MLCYEERVDARDRARELLVDAFRNTARSGSCSLLVPRKAEQPGAMHVCRVQKKQTRVCGQVGLLDRHKGKAGERHNPNVTKVV